MLRVGSPVDRRAVLGSDIVALSVPLCWVVLLPEVLEQDVDIDPIRPGIQFEAPAYSEPEFLLQAGNERWNLRNRPAGTVAAGFGHKDETIDDALMATARYQPLNANPAAYGTLGADRSPIDVAVLLPTEFRTFTWIVTRYDDASVEVSGPVEKNSPQRYVYGAGGLRLSSR